MLQGDGGTRTASITGGFIALALCLEKLKEEGTLLKVPILDYVGAVSVGVCSGEAKLDLDYREDSSADVDMNVVMTGKGKFIEVQGTAEKVPFSKKQMESLLTLATKGINELIKTQKKILKNNYS